MKAILLGTAQDGGIPQTGCYCPTCKQARNNPPLQQKAACLGLIDYNTRQSWLIDATPDFKAQHHALQTIAPTCPLSGIILTHAHTGHYVGLYNLGKEMMATHKLPVFVSPKMAHFLSTNAPWSQLIIEKNIILHLLKPQHPLILSPKISLIPYPVPHRNELSDTLAFLIKTTTHTLFYCPDIDAWQQWQHNLKSFLANINIALLDGTFFNATDLPHRPLSEIPHPLITNTVALLSKTACDVYFIHLNHSNPLLQNGKERHWLTTQGFKIGKAGQSWDLNG